MSFGLLDLSLVTDRLVDLLKACTSETKIWPPDGTGRFTISYTGLAPDVARKTGGCQVSVYLFHVAADKFHRNTYPTGGPPQTVPQQPLGLALYYLVTAYSEKSHNEEQQAMSIVLKCLHEHPLLRVPVPGEKREVECTLTIEPQTVDEVGRLWQSITAPLRLSAVYRASVVFLLPPPPVIPKPVRVEPKPEPKPMEEEDLRPPAPVVFTADPSGRVRIEVPSAGFVAGQTRARIRALALTETTTNPPEPGRFRVVSSNDLDLQVPAGTPSGGYLLHVSPATGKPNLELQVIVP